MYGVRIKKKIKKVKKSDFPRSPRAPRADHSRKHSSDLIKLICYFASASESQKFPRTPRADFSRADFSKASTLLYQIFLFYREPVPMLLGSAHSETSYPISSGDNIPLNSSYLHGIYIIHILMLLVIHILLVCMEVAGVSSGEYDTLLDVCSPLHKSPLHWNDTGKCIYLPFDIIPG
jgi:hypothetical protein